MGSKSQSWQQAVGLRVGGLTKEYARRDKLGLRQRRILAADSVSFDIAAGTTLALIGSSGSGKSTVARCVSRLEMPDEGDVWIGQTNIARLPSAELRPLRGRIQMIFQDPATAINPRFSAAEVIEEPLLLQHKFSPRERREIITKLMTEVGLRPDWAGRRAHSFSGGQKQRLAIARALTLQPNILILDEALTGLDLSTQAQIANLLLDLQAAHGMAYLLISHDLKLVTQIADAVAVMSEGKIVEQGPTAQVLASPTHEATRNLLRSAPKFPLATSAKAGSTP